LPIFRQAQTNNIESTMLKLGTRVELTKGYKGVKGVITETADSQYEFYVVALDNGINIVVGPSAFIVKQDLKSEPSVL
jgi:hypothetical protein